MDDLLHVTLLDRLKEVLHEGLHLRIHLVVTLGLGVQGGLLLSRHWI